MGYMNIVKSKVYWLLSPKTLFSFTWIIQKKLIRFAAKRRADLNVENKIESLHALSKMTFFLFLLISSINFKLVFLFYLSILFMFTISFLRYIEKPFISVSGFVRNGLLMILILDIFIFVIIFSFSPAINSSDFIHWLIVNIVILITWCLFSIIINNNASKLINSCFAAFFAIASIITNLLISILPDDYVGKLLNSDIPKGYTYKQILTILCALFFVFPLITNILAVTLCSAKEYWIKKYNNGDDISEEMIEQEIERIRNETIVTEEINV